MVERCVRDAEAVGSSPVTSTSNDHNEKISISLVKWKFLFVSVDIKYMIIVPYYRQEISDLLTSILIKLADNGKNYTHNSCYLYIKFTQNFSCDVLTL